jgi:hypothetical protein
MLAHVAGRFGRGDIEDQSESIPILDAAVRWQVKVFGSRSM